MKILESLAILFAVAGVVVGMMLGIISALFNLKDEKSHRLTKWGKIGVVGIVLTAILTLASQFINSKQEAAKLEEAKKDQTEKLRAEVRRFQELNDQLERNSRPVDTLVAGFELEIPITDEGSTYLNRARAVSYPYPFWAGPVSVDPQVVVTAVFPPATNRAEKLTVKRFQVTPDSPLYPKAAGAFKEDASFLTEIYSLMEGVNVQVNVFPSVQAGLHGNAPADFGFILTGGIKYVDVEPARGLLIVGRTDMDWDKRRLTKNIKFNVLDDFRGKTILISLCRRKVFAELPVADQSEPKLSGRIKLRSLFLSFNGRKLHFGTLANTQIVEDTEAKTTIAFTFPSNESEFFNVWQ